MEFGGAVVDIEALSGAEKVVQVEGALVAPVEQAKEESQEEETEAVSGVDGTGSAWRFA